MLIRRKFFSDKENRKEGNSLDREDKKTKRVIAASAVGSGLALGASKYADVKSDHLFEKAAQSGRLINNVDTLIKLADERAADKIAKVYTKGGGNIEHKVDAITDDLRRTIRRLENRQDRLARTRANLIKKGNFLYKNLSNEGLALGAGLAATSAYNVYKHRKNKKNNSDATQST